MIVQTQWARIVLKECLGKDIIPPPSSPHVIRTTTHSVTSSILKYDMFRTLVGLYN